MKYVYLIQSLENGYYKIGVSKNPKKRIKQLKTGNSSKLKLIETYKSDLANKIEKSLHHRYSHLKKEGEWFELSVNEESNFNNDCETIENNFNVLIEHGNKFID